ncbi:MAG: AI-2E family transporter [Methanobacteriaceae archaeon]|jgi:predicted PurR-regulated permease PerM|nr:AI-2E family transporter [Methanobacteriaceae archaeon]
MNKNIIELITNQSVIILILLIISIVTLMPVFNMLILGAIIAYGVRPIIFKIKSKVKYNSIAILFTILVFVVPLILLIIYVFSAIGSISFDLINSNLEFSQLNIEYIINHITQYIPINQVQITNNISSFIYDSLSDVLHLIANYAIKIAQRIPFLALEIFILIASIFYFARDGAKCYEFVKSIVPKENMSFFNTLTEQIENVLVSIFYGHFLTSLIIGIIAFVGYFILGYPYALFLGILTGIFQLIPIMGPWPIYWILAILDFINGDYISAVIVILFGFVLSLSDVYIRPALTSQHTDIHPLVLLTGFLAGPLVFGMMGLILGPLILGITYAVIKAYKIEKNEVV